MTKKLLSVTIWGYVTPYSKIKGAGSVEPAPSFYTLKNIFFLYKK